MAEILADDATFLAERGRIEAEREAQLAELRQLNQPGDVNINQSANRRFYAGQLTADIVEIDRRRELVRQQLELCRQALVKADQEVRALEKLEEKQRAEFVLQTERRTAAQLEDAWQATHFTEAYR